MNQQHAVEPDTNSAGTGGVVELNEADFPRSIENHATVLVDFWAPWCGPCRGFAPVFAAAAKAHPGILFAKVNVDENQTLAVHYGVRAIPTLIAFRDGKPVHAQAGALPAPTLQSVIDGIKRDAS